MISEKELNEDDCPQGLTAEVIKLIAAAAKLEAKRNFEEKKRCCECCVQEI